MFVLMVLYEACSPACSSAAKTAVQLLFGRAHLVSKHFLILCNPGFVNKTSKILNSVYSSKFTIKYVFQNKLQAHVFTC